MLLGLGHSPSGQRVPRCVVEEDFPCLFTIDATYLVATQN